MHRPTGPGRTERRSSPPSLLIYNFDIDGDQLKPDHQDFLRREVVPALQRGGSVSIVGLASRSGRAPHNDALSMRRAQNTLTFLRNVVRNGFASRQVVARGERQAAQEGYRDGTEDERFRSVVIFVIAGPAPPPPPPVIDVTPLLPNIPAPDDGPLDTLGTVLNTTGFLTGMVEPVTGIFGLVVSSTLATFLDLAGILVSAGSTIIALPAAWLTGDRLAKFNGACQGFWNAMQDMADAFSNPALDAMPQSSWPPIPHPRPHLPSIPEESLHEEDRQWRAGEREGCQKAYDTIMRMEFAPLVLRQVIGGRLRTIRLTGRMFLRILAHTYGRRVADVVKAETNRRLRAQGREEWPLIK